MKTIRVRIPIVVTNDGEWYASAFADAGGQTESDRDHASDTVRESLSELCGTDDFRLSWIEADVPLPDEVTVKGRVIPAGETTKACRARGSQ